MSPENIAEVWVASCISQTLGQLGVIPEGRILDSITYIYLYRYVGTFGSEHYCIGMEPNKTFYFNATR
jgi:hypothetical protein